MDIGQEGQRGGKQEKAVYEAGRRADPPGLEAEACEQEEVVVREEGYSGGLKP
jgi:hypothetical protein